MRKLIVTEFVSLDGVMEAPGGEPGYAHSGWVAPHFTPELAAHKLAEQLAADVLLLGRRTYESFAGAWPQREGPMADKINTMTKVVASTTLESADWHDSTVIASDMPGAVAALKDGDGGPVLVAGSRSLVHGLLEAGLVDELNLQVFPVVLGSGARLYPETAEPLALELLSSEPLPNGVLVQSYRVGS
jgi:dihydrofolate reductase